MAKRGRPTLDEVLSDVKKAKAQKTKVKRTLKTKEAQIKKLETTLNNKHRPRRKNPNSIEESGFLGFCFVANK